MSAQAQTRGGAVASARIGRSHEAGDTIAVCRHVSGRVRNAVQAVRLHPGDRHIGAAGPSQRQGDADTRWRGVVEAQRADCPSERSSALCVIVARGK